MNRALILVLIVASAGCPGARRAPVTARGDQPLIESGPWIASRSTGEPGPFSIAVRVELTRTPAPGELEVSVRDGERAIPPVGTTCRARDCRVKFTLPGAGNYEVTAAAGEQRFTSRIEARVVACVGGRRVLMAFADQGPELVFDWGPAAEPIPGILAVRRWHVDDRDQAHVIVWLHEGRAVAAEQGRDHGLSQASHRIESARSLAELAGERLLCPFSHGKDVYDLPADLLTRAGGWEARIHRDGEPSLAVRFEVLADGTIAGMRPRLTYWKDDEAVSIAVAAEGFDGGAAARALLARVPRHPGHEHRWLENPVYHATPEELRALTRSPELLQLRIRFNELMHGSGGGSVGLYFTAQEDYELSPEQKWQRLAQARAAADRDAAAETRRMRARARTMLPRLKQLIRMHGQPLEL